MRSIDVLVYHRFYTYITTYQSKGVSDTMFILKRKPSHCVCAKDNI